jgi:hypothetical protein
MDRVEEFLGNRLRGRRVPEDLRRLVEMHLDGELGEHVGVTPFGEFELLGPGVMHPLEQPLEPVPTDPQPELTRANIRAISRVLEHVAAVVRDFDDNLWGYWFHPDEPVDASPLIVKYTTEGEFSTSGGNLVEAMAFDRDDERDVSELVEYCARHRVPFTARTGADIRERWPVTHPAELHEELFERLQAGG